MFPLSGGLRRTARLFHRERHVDPGGRCEFWTGMRSEEPTRRVRQSVELRGPHTLHGAGRPAAGSRL